MAREIDIKIRKAKNKDIKTIALILMTESAKPPYNEKYVIKSALKEIKLLIKNEVFLAETKKEVIGFIASSINPYNNDRAYISELWLKKEFQKKGIGTDLITFIEKFYKNKKVKKIRLTSNNKTKAFDFYKKNKFKEIKELVYMEKKLK